jgi:hypothetical protein
MSLLLDSCISILIIIYYTLYNICTVNIQTPITQINTNTNNNTNINTNNNNNKTHN